MHVCRLLFAYVQFCASLCACAPVCPALIEQGTGGIEPEQVIKKNPARWRPLPGSKQGGNVKGGKAAWWPPLTTRTESFVTLGD